MSIIRSSDRRNLGHAVRFLSSPFTGGQVLAKSSVSLCCTGTQLSRKSGTHRAASRRGGQKFLRLFDPSYILITCRRLMAVTAGNLRGIAGGRTNPTVVRSQSNSARTRNHYRAVLRPVVARFCRSSATANQGRRGSSVRPAPRGPTSASGSRFREGRLLAIAGLRPAPGRRTRPGASVSPNSFRPPPDRARRHPGGGSHCGSATIARGIRLRRRDQTTAAAHQGAARRLKIAPEWARYRSLLQ